jgi:hypothetical protein
MALGFIFRSRQAVVQRLSKVWMPIGLSLALLLTGLLTGCSLPQVSAQSRLFLNLSASLVASYTLPQTDFNGMSVGGFSGLSYDAQQDRIYALVQDKVNPRFYTLHLDRREGSGSAALTVEAVTFLQDHLQIEGLESASTLDGEGMVLTRQGTVFVASKGDQGLKIPPRLSGFNRTDGNWQQTLTLPQQYWAFDPKGNFELGIDSNHGLKSLATNAEGDRLFSATAGPLQQDIAHNYSRFLHYWIGEPEPILISEHLYPLEADSAEGTLSGLSDLASIDNAGHFISLEHRYSPTTGYSAALYQIATGVATDISGIPTLPTNLKGIVPILKQPLLNLAALAIPLQNLEGLAFGPRLQDGSRSLLLISNNHLDAKVPTQVLMLRLDSRPTQVKA